MLLLVFIAHYYTGTKRNVDKAKELLDILAPGAILLCFDKSPLTLGSARNIKAVLDYVSHNANY